MWLGVLTILVVPIYCNVRFDYSDVKILWFYQQVQNFGEPFFLVIHEGETLAEVKLRIQKKLQVPDEEFAKVYYFPVFAVVLLGQHIVGDTVVSFLTTSWCYHLSPC